ncbi:hypothetical protein KAH37_04135 [bacterium]|nr:hypothetical protein [bacterium]
MRTSAFFILLVVSSLFFIACDNKIQTKEDITDTADSADSANTADSADSADTADTADSANTADTSDSADTGDTADSGNTVAPVVVGSFSVEYSGDIVDAEASPGAGGMGDATFSFNEDEITYSELDSGGYLHLPAATLKDEKISVRWRAQLTTGVTQLGMFFAGVSSDAPEGSFFFSEYGGFALYGKAELVGGSWTLQCVYAISNPEKSEMTITSKTATSIAFTATGELLDPKIIEDKLTIPICE